MIEKDEEKGVYATAAAAAEGSESEGEKEKNANLPPPASFAELFKFSTTFDKLVFALGAVMSVLAGATLPAIVVVFGRIIDVMSQEAKITDRVSTEVKYMLLVGVYGFCTFFLAFSLCGWAAANVANSYRKQYLQGVLRQDGEFFDHTEPGSLSLILSDAALDIQAALGDKFANAVQGLCQLIFAFGVAFWYGPLLTVVLMAGLVLLVGVTTLMVTWGSEDGMFGKEAYEVAGGIASETLANIRTVFSLNAETTMSARYVSKLDDTKNAAIRQSIRAASLTGLLFFVIFCMYGVGFWFGAKIIADSTDIAIRDHPPPPGFLWAETDDDPSWLIQKMLVIGNDTDPGFCTEYITYDTVTGNMLPFRDNEPLQVCACGIPWDFFPIVVNPECGCGAGGDNKGFDTSESCFTGGTTLLVFFAVLLGGLGAGQCSPGAKALGNGRLSAAKMLKTIERKPYIDITKKGDPKFDQKAAAAKGGITGEITFDNVHFRYRSKAAYDANSSDDDDESKNVFGGFNLTMKAGETVALVGESGCGKSTIAKLIQRFYDPTQGRILLDGHDLKDLSLSTLREKIGVVSQEPLLFNRSVKENIRYGKPDATDEEIITAAKAANAHDFINRFPDGYDTGVGAKGCKLSGGQKQRVAIARAILRNPPILILDEATSALDNKSEKIVQKALDRLVEENNRQRTTIVIAHRLSTVRNADKIVVLGSPSGFSTSRTGSILLEQGTHDELMNVEGGFYKALVGAGQRSGGGNNSSSSTTTNNNDNDDIDVDAYMESIAGDKAEDTDSNTEMDESLASMKSSGKGSEAEEKKGFWASMMGGKKDDTIKGPDVDKSQVKLNKARLWSYTQPEMPWIIFGGLASIIKGTIFPLIAVVFSEMISAWYSSDTEDLREESLRWSFLFYVLAVLAFFSEAIQKGVFEMVGERLTQRLRGDLFRTFLRQDITWFEKDENALGMLCSRLSTDVKIVRLAAGQNVAATLESASALTTGIIISYMASWEVFLIMLSMVPILGAVEALQWVAMTGSEEGIRSALSKGTDKLHESIVGIREVQAFSMENMIQGELQELIDTNILPASMTSAISKGVMMGMIQLVQFSVYAFAYWFGAEMIAKGRITFDDFNMALWAMAFAASGLGQAAIFAGDAASASVALNNIFASLDSDPSIASEPWEDRGKADIKTGIAKTRQVKEGSLKDGTSQLVKVNFAYPTRKTAKIFDEIDLTIPSGKVVALVGSSGSGKSTVIQLLERFYDPISYKEEVQEDTGEKITEAVPVEKNGDVLVGGESMKTADCRWLRNNFALVGQEPVLFNDTIYNNIALGKAENCTRQDVEEAARRANAYDFIMKLDLGFDTLVGTAGGKVSGGQKQRIAIARALVSNPKILLLDEATSALDNESEKIVQASLDALVQEADGDRTTIIIAHRLSTIKNADIICVLENSGSGSKVCESGSHDELMALGQKYKALVEAYEK